MTTKARDSQIRGSTVPGLSVADQPERAGRRIGPIAESLAIYLLLIISVLIVLVPLWWMGASSFTTRETVWKNVLPFSLRAFWPEDFTLNGYRAIFNDGFGRSILNTLFVSLSTVILTIAVCAPAGFAFGRFNFRGRTVLWVLVLASLMVPWEATVIPAYSLINSLGWLNTWQALIIPAIANGTVMFLFRQFFSQIPQDLLDAARVDGASWPRVLTGIVMPLSIPVLVTASILVFLAQWNAFFWPLLVAPAERYRMVQVAVSVLGVNQELRYWDMIFASSTLAAVVPLILVLPLQRFYVGSIVGSGVKQ